jgi:hypothetical protein
MTFECSVQIRIAVGTVADACLCVVSKTRWCSRRSATTMRCTCCRPGVRRMARVLRLPLGKEPANEGG